MKHAAAALLLFSAILPAAQPEALALRTRIALPDVKGRIDHFSVDLHGNRLFIAALGNKTIEVLDVAHSKRIHTIADIAEPQGLYFDPASNHLFAATQQDGTVKVFDGGNYQLLRTTNLGGDADNIRYDERGRRVVVGFGSGALAFLDSSGKKTGQIPLDAHPESFQLEKAGTRAFVNVPDRKEIEVVDLAKDAVLAKWPVTSALKNYPMALDEAHHRLLIGCREPARMLVFDTGTGKQTASIEIVADTDDLFFDPSGGRVYVIGGGGSVDVLEQKDADHYTSVQHIQTAPGARTGYFSADWSKLFVAVPHRGEHAAEVLVFEAALAPASRSRQK
jgi:DNA-binding beta-propeller fold protein YncE